MHNMLITQLRVQKKTNIPIHNGENYYIFDAKKIRRNHFKDILNKNLNCKLMLIMEMEVHFCLSQLFF